MSNPAAAAPAPQGAAPPPLSNLIRPAHVLSLFRHYPERKTHYFDGCTQLWNAILVNPQGSPAHRQAYSGLAALTQSVRDGLARQREREAAAAEAERASRREREQEQERMQLLQLRQRQRQQVQAQSEREQVAFQTLMRQVAASSGPGSCVPSLADFEAGLSAFQLYGAGQEAGATTTMTAAGAPGGGAGAVAERDARLVQDDVETALALLNVGAEKASVEDVYAGLTLLGVEICVRVEEYLREVAKEGM